MGGAVGAHAPNHNAMRSNETPRVKRVHLGDRFGSQNRVLGHQICLSSYAFYLIDMPLPAVSLMAFHDNKTVFFTPSGIGT